MPSFEESDGGGDMDPDSAAEFALSDGDDVASGGGGFGANGPMGRLFDGDATGPGVGEIEADYGISKHWAVFTRGCVRVATGSGIPPIVEIVLGGGLALVKAARSGDDGGADEWGVPADDSELSPS